MRWIDRLANCWQSNHRYDWDATIELWLGYEDDGRLDSSYRSCHASSVQCPVTERACHVTRDGRRPRASSVSSHICLELQIPVNKRLSIEPNRRRGAGELSLSLSLPSFEFVDSSAVRCLQYVVVRRTAVGEETLPLRATNLPSSHPATHPLLLLLLQVAVFYVFISFFHFLLFSTV